MRKNTQKLIALLVVLAMGCMLFVGCSNQEEPTNNTDAQISTSPATTESEEPVESLSNAERFPISSNVSFTVASTLEGADEMSNLTLFEEVVGLDVTYQTYTTEQLKLALAGGTFPDAALFTYEWLDKAAAYEYGTAGKIINFMDYLEYMPNFSRLIEEDPSILDPVINDDGSVYTLPCYQRTSTVAGNLLYFRTDMMKEAGWDTPPATTEEFLQYIKDVQAHFGADDPEFIAFTANNNHSMKYNNVIANYFFPAFGELLQTGITVTQDGKNIAVGAATEQYRLYLEFMNEVYESGAFQTDIYTDDGTKSRALVSQNKSAVTPYASFLTKDNFASGELDMIILEPLTSEYSSKQQWLAPSLSQYMINIINSECEDIPALCQFFDAMYAPQDDPLNEEGTIWGLSLWLGELGVDFTLDAASNTYAILPHEGYDSSSGWCLSNGLGGSNGTGNFMYLEKSGTGLQIKGEGTINNLMPYSVDIVRSNFLLLTEDEQMIYADAWTDIETYIGEMTAKFIVGAEDIESEWDTYLSNLESMGLQDVIDVYQASLDRYNG